MIKELLCILRLLLYSNAVLLIITLLKLSYSPHSDKFALFVVVGAETVDDIPQIKGCHLLGGERCL